MSIEYSSTMSHEEAAKMDLSIILALMNRLKLTEVHIKSEELPPKSVKEAGLQILTDADGSLTVIMLEPGVADAILESQGRLKS